jgi:hypothetical protein
LRSSIVTMAVPDRCIPTMQTGMIFLPQRWGLLPNRRSVALFGQPAQDCPMLGADYDPMRAGSGKRYPRREIRLQLGLLLRPQDCENDPQKPGYSFA